MAIGKIINHDGGRGARSKRSRDDVGPATGCEGHHDLDATFAHAVNPSLYNKLRFDPHKDFAAVSLIARSFDIIVVNPASKINAISDLIAEATAKPGKLNFGTFGIGTSAHSRASCSIPWRRSR